MSYSKISIVTPSYNHARFIERTVRSVVGQRYPNLEYIVMDGGSSDNTVDILKPYEAHISHLTSARDGGQSDAIASGFERSTGEIMAWLNSDDMLAPGALDYVNWFFKNNPDVDFIYSHRLAVDADDKAIWYWLLPRHSSYLMSRWDLIPQETCFWRRSLWEKGGNVDRSFQFAMDYDLFVRYMKIGRFRRANRFLGAFRQHDSAKTSQLLATVGAREINRVWVDNGMKPHFFSPLLAHRFSKSVTWRGMRFALNGKVLPGCLSGIGYSYDRVWAGQLLGG
ncbi:glycosyltransferase family 2 protein [Ancylobacter sp. G4_0304]|uniref:glycosyltransferase family 2 protein n=1 Tax=Ancylobacter sp. G4_0304 TaxID=3114289 RepID=UPI0039C68814